MSDTPVERVENDVARLVITRTPATPERGYRRMDNPNAYDRRGAIIRVEARDHTGEGRWWEMGDSADEVALVQLALEVVTRGMPLAMLAERLEHVARHGTL